MSGNFQLWSQTAASNDVADASVPWPEGMQPGQVNNSARAMMAAIASWRDDTNGSITTGGSANSLTFTSAQTLTTYLNNIRITAKAGATNTGAATLNLNTIGAKSIRSFYTGAEAVIAAGQIIANGVYDFRYDTAANAAAGAWILLNPTPDPTTIAGPGTIKIWPSDTLPAGWLWCNGALYLQSDYPNLYAVLITAYGGDATHFNVPNYMGRAPFGQDDMGGIAQANRITNAGSGIVGTTLGAVGGVESVTLALTQIPSHVHSGNTLASGAPHSHTFTTDSGGVDHTHNSNDAVAKTGTFTGPGSNGWGGGTTTTATSGASAFAHTHTGTTGGASTTDHVHAFTSDANGGGQLHTNMPPAIIQNFIIKT